MEELLIDEKAKRYDKAIERAKNYYSTTDSASDIKLIGLIFPELKESEDERMRKIAIEACKYMVDNFENSTRRYEEAIAWLEKQGEQKYAWSEEDEKVIHCLEYTIKHFYEDEDTIKWCCDWLKSLRPQNTWKPSDEQMKLLREVQQALLGKDCHNRFVVFMHELKRLREE